MNLPRYDVIIIGAGPAGCIAGYHLSASGFRVLILEKSTIQNKPCGGGLTHRALKEIPFSISHLIHKDIHWGTVAFHGMNIGNIRNTKHDQAIAHLIDRQTFDPYLLSMAQKQGAALQTNAKVINILQGQQAITVKTKSKAFTAQYVIGADGIQSLTAQQSGLIQHRKTSLSYEAHLEIPSDTTNPTLKSIVFDFGTLLWGYGWIFPKKDHLNVGVFRSWPGKKTSRRILLRYIKQHPILRKAKILNMRAYPIPQGGIRQPLHNENLLLVGDAANLADPWLGEGLYYAFASGRMAAETIIRREKQQLPDLAEYSNLVYHILSRQLAYAKRLSFFINLFPFFNTAFLSISPTLQKMIIGLFRGDITQREIWHEIKYHLPRLVFQVLTGR
jgi:geranylgeranyl reductase family protein